MKKNETNFAIQELAEKDQKDYLLNANFTIIDEQNNPINEATITCGDKTTVTTINGIGVLLGLKNNQYDVTISKDGYDDKTTSIIKDIREQNFTITLEQTKVNINIKVTDGVDILNANVTLVSTKDNTTSYVCSVENGNGTISSIPVGLYNVTASAENHENYTGSIEVTKDKTSFDIELLQVFQIEGPTLEETEEEGFF